MFWQLGSALEIRSSAQSVFMSHSCSRKASADDRNKTMDVRDLLLYSLQSQ